MNLTDYLPYLIDTPTHPPLTASCPSLLILLTDTLLHPSQNRRHHGR